jgi:hypothetical protein
MVADISHLPWLLPGNATLSARSLVERAVAHWPWNVSGTICLIWT